MRLTLKEKGKSYTKDTVTPYVETYIQPIHNAAIAWLYHFIWEKLTFRILLCIEKKFPKKFGKELTLDDGEKVHIPTTAVQDMRCFELNRKNRVTLLIEYGEPEPKE